MTTRKKLLQVIRFGEGTHDGNHLGAGWSSPEEGHRWTEEGASELWLENPMPGTMFRLEIDVEPLLYALHPVQRLIVRARDTVVARATFIDERPCAIAIPAWIVTAPGPVRLSFEHPDFCRPIDFELSDDDRKLAFAFRALRLYRVYGDAGMDKMEPGRGVSMTEVEQATGMAAAAFMTHFESLGDNCEFGLVQRRCGAEPLGLLRFAFMDLENLVRALRTRFEGMGTLENLEVATPEGEYDIRDRAYGFAYHTWQRQGSLDETTLLPQQANRIDFLVRRLIRQMTDAGKIFVWKRNRQTSEAEIRELHAALCAYGPNTLLWAAPADGNHRLGSVDMIGPGLLRANMERFAPYDNGHDFILELWLEVCVKAWRVINKTP